MATYQAGLCWMHKGILDTPHEGATIEAGSNPDAIAKAKEWARPIEDMEGAWLQVLLDGTSIASLNPGEF